MNSQNSARVVVITGASAGVGRAAAHAFANEGACIGLIAFLAIIGVLFGGFFQNNAS
jgi:NADP-dependent 3-hydroxy acid dehydrogenase YdfG